MVLRPLLNFIIPPFTFIAISAILIILLTIIFGEIYAHMSYNRWFYEFTDDSLRIEHGIIWKVYKSIPYGRIQNVDIRRGIIARMFGFFSLDIQTAGYSRGYGRRGTPRSEGYLPAVGVDDAEKIREFVIKKIKGKKASGL